MKELGTLKDFVNEVFMTDLCVVDFWAEWCESCKRLEPILTDFELKYKHIKFFKVNIEKSPHISEHYFVQGLPTIAFFKNGNLLNRYVGLPNKKETIEEIINKL